MKKRLLSARVCAGVVCVSVATSMSPAAGIAFAVTQGETAGLYGVSTLSGESDEESIAAASAEEEQFDLSLLGSDDWSSLWLDEDLSKPSIGRHYFANDTLGIGRWLTQGKDFEVLDWYRFENGYVPLNGAPTTPGNYYLKVKGIGSYKGESYAAVEMYSPSDISHCYASVLNTVWLDDKVLPSVEVYRKKDGESVSLQSGDFTVDGWYTHESVSGVYSYVKVDGDLPAAGGYYLKISGTSPAYEGERYLWVNVRDRYDLSSYWANTTETLWTGDIPSLEELPLSVYRDDYRLEYGKDYKAVGWYLLEDGGYVPLSSTPSEAGIYYLKLEGIGSYSGSRLTQVNIQDRQDLSSYWGYATETLWTDKLPSLEEFPLEVYRWFDSDDHVTLESGIDYKATGWYTYDHEAPGDHYVQMTEPPAEYGSYYVKVEGIGSYHGSMYCSVNVRDRYEFSTCWASFDEQLWTDGNLALESLPLRVCTEDRDPIEDHTLEQGKHYTVSGWYTYVDGEAGQPITGAPSTTGTYCLKLQGIFPYKGDKVVPVTVHGAYDLSEYYASSNRSLWLDDLDCSGVSLYRVMGGKHYELAQGTDYTLSGWYTRSGSAYSRLEGTPKATGEYWLKAEGAGSYSGEQYVPVSVWDRYDLSSYRISARGELWDDSDMSAYPALYVRTPDYERAQDVTYDIDGWYVKAGDSYSAIKGTPSSAGDYYLKLTGNGLFHGSTYVWVNIRDSEDISSYNVYCMRGMWLDDNLALSELSVQVSRDIGDAEERVFLTRDKDYEVEGWYSLGSTGGYIPLEDNPRSAGSYYLKIKGKSAYKGERFVRVIVKDRNDISSYEFYSIGSLWDDSNLSNPAAFIESYDDDLDLGEEFSTAGWYARHDGAYISVDTPNAAGTYYLKLEGIAPYIGEEYVRVNVRDSRDVSEYQGTLADTLWTDSSLDLTDLPLSVYRYDSISEKRTYLERDKDYEVVGWYTGYYDYDDDCEPLDGAPAASGDYSILIKGTGENYYGDKYIGVHVYDSKNIEDCYVSCSGIRWLDDSLAPSDIEVRVRRDLPGTEESIFLTRDKDFVVSGWYTQNPETGGYTPIEGNPSTAGTYYLKVEGNDPFTGKEYIRINVKDRYALSSYDIYSYSTLWDDSDFSNPAAFIEEYDGDLSLGEEIAAAGWYTSDENGYTELDGAPAAAGTYYLKVEGITPYIGEEYVRVNVRDSHDVNKYWGELADTLWSDGSLNLSDLSLNVYRYDCTSMSETYLERDKDYEAVGWFTYDYDNDCESLGTNPTTPGEYTIKIKGIGNDYYGEKYVYAVVKDPKDISGYTVDFESELTLGTDLSDPELSVHRVNPNTKQNEYLVKGRDFEVVGWHEYDSDETVESPTAQGDWSLVLKGKGSFKGTQYISVELEEPSTPGGGTGGGSTTPVTPPATDTEVGEKTEGVVISGGSDGAEGGSTTADVTVTDTAPAMDSQGNAVDGSVSISNISSTEGDVVIPETVTLEGKTYLVTQIPAGAMKDNETATSVTIPASVTAIGEGAFSGCESLTSVSIPEGSSVGTGAFAGSGLTSVTIPSGAELGSRAFQGCEDLKSVTVEKGVGCLPAYAFKGCTSLKSVTIKSGVTAIERSAFSGCTSLKSLTLPKGVESIGKYALYGAEKVKTLTVNSKNLTKASVKGALKGSSVTTVLVPKSMLSKYTKVFSKANCGKKVVVKVIKKRG